jgi:hypothetical protein
MRHRPRTIKGAIGARFFGLLLGAVLVLLVRLGRRGD